MNCQEEALNYKKHEFLSKWFQSQVELTPNQVALQDGQISYTFRELDELTTLLARYLIVKFGVKINSSVVPIFMEVSIEYVIANIAIIKSGGAYMNLYPPAATGAINEMCTKVKPVCFIASVTTSPQLKGVNVPSFVMDGDWTNRILNSDCDLKVEFPNCKFDDVAFVAYTSGTTGKPKAMLCRQYSPLYSYNYVHEMIPFEENEVYGCCLFLSWEVMRPLLKGVTAFIMDESTMNDNELLGQCVKQNSITRILITPSRFEQMLMDPNFNPDDYLSIKYLLVCGEVLTVTLAKRLLATFPWTKMYNLYSTAETYDAALLDINEFFENGGESESVYCPVGKPFAEVTAHILDDYKQPVPVGKPGEIYIESPALSKEYIKDPEQTKRAFTINSNGKLVYKTGDVGRFSLDNNLEIWGRCDSMVKMKGRSVNIKAIEIQLLKHPSVNACALSVTGELSKRKIIAYIVPNGKVTEKELEDHLASKYLKDMIPHQFVFLKSVPINVQTSKFDLKSLTKPAKI